MAASEQLLAALHEALANDLLNKIANGEATAAEMAVARGLLKDSNITCAPEKDTALGELEEQLAKKREERAARRKSMAAVGSATPIDFGQALADFDHHGLPQ